MRRPWVAFGILGLFAVLSATWFLYLRHLGTEINYGFDFGSVADATALAFVAIFVDYLYSKHSSDHRADTELLLESVKDAKEAFRTLIKESHNCESGKPLSKPQRITLIDADRELSNAVHSLEFALAQCSADLSKLKFAGLKDARSEIKDSLTDTPYPGPYDANSLSRIRLAQTNMRDQLTRIAFAINRR
jgi:hypothetical protein